MKISIKLMFFFLHFSQFTQIFINPQGTVNKGVHCKLTGILLSVTKNLVTNI